MNVGIVFFKDIFGSLGLDYNNIFYFQVQNLENQHIFFGKLTSSRRDLLAGDKIRNDKAYLEEEWSGSGKLAGSRYRRTDSGPL